MVGEPPRPTGVVQFGQPSKCSSSTRTGHPPAIRLRPQSATHLMAHERTTAAPAPTGLGRWGHAAD